MGQCYGEVTCMKVVSDCILRPILIYIHVINVTPFTCNQIRPIPPPQKKFLILCNMSVLFNIKFPFYILDKISMLSASDLENLTIKKYLSLSVGLLVVTCFNTSRTKSKDTTLISICLTDN